MIFLKPLLLLIPISAWALMTRRTRLGWAAGGLVLVAAGAALALAEQWIAATERYTLLVMVVYATVLALGMAAAVELRRPFPARQVIGLLLAICYAVVPFGMAFFLFFGEPDFRPSSSEVLPLPARLAVVSDRDDGCDHTSLHNDCGREIQVRGASGQPDGDVALQLLDYLTRQRGWRLDPTQVGGPGWTGCHEEGRMLDRHEVCVTITGVAGGARLDVDADNYLDADDEP
ncbi:hypothetical protein FHX73_115001 [Kitasatospora viridis]|uniref:Uncharacterized protein n=2 Tax=Kitasatospora viridis TaxID=281105 RepID=A0A561UP42_9ACTN|nr:hypothetical protein FHX73_115001 [Kitasatospora viridis]